jgi:hypothetical protein
LLSLKHEESRHSRPFISGCPNRISTNQSN